MSTQIYLVAELAARLQKEFPDAYPHKIAEFVEWVTRQSKRHAKLCCDYCNDSNFNIDTLDKLEAKIEDEIAERWAVTWKIPVTAFFQRDPRGVTLKLKVPSGYTNDWGADGINTPQ